MPLSLSGTFGTHAGGGPHMTPLNSLSNRLIRRFWPTMGPKSLSGVWKEMTRFGECDTAIIGLEGR